MVVRSALGRGRFPLRNLIILCFILLIAFALRVYRLDAQSFSDDEFLSVLHTNVPLDRVLIGIPVDHTPGYFILLHYWLKLGGDVDFSLRLLSVLWGVLGVALTFLLGRRLFSPRVGLWSALLLALNPFALYYSQEARMYSQLYALSAAALYAFARLYEHPEKRRWWIVHSLMLAAALYTHYYALSIPLAQTVFLLFERTRTTRKLWIQWLIGLAVVGLLFVPWLPHLWQLLHTHAWQVPVNPLSYPATLWSSFLAGSTVPDAILPVLAFVSMLLIMMSVHLTRHTWQGRFLTLLLLLPLAVLLILLTLRGNGPMVRYFNVLFPAFIVLVAGGVDGMALELSRRSNLWRMMPANGLTAAMVLLYCGIGMYSLQNYWFDARYSHPDWRAAATWLMQHERLGDLILFDGQDPSVNFVRYYHGRVAFREFPAFKSKTTDTQVDAAMTRTTAQATRVWSILLAREPGRGEAWLNARGFQGDYEEFSGIYVTPLILKTDLGVARTPQGVETDLDVSLENYKVGPLESGRYLPVRLNWKNGATPLDRDFTVSLRLYDAQGNQISALDRVPRGGFYPTMAWKPNEEIVDSYALTVPGPTSGSFSLSVLLYDPADGAPHLQARLGRVEIQAQASATSQ